jgi:hypothetical protein
MMFDQENKKKGAKTQQRMRDNKPLDETVSAVNRDLEVVKSRLMMKSNTSKDLDSYQ